MDTIAKRLKAARSHRGISQAQLANLVGCGQSSIGSIENERNHSSALLIPIAMALKINPIWLAEGKGTMLDPLQGDSSPMPPTPGSRGPGRVRLWNSPEDLEPDEDRVWVDRYDYRVSAGDGGVQWEIRQKKALPFTLEFFRAIGANPEHCRLLSVRGDSMEPFLYHRDMVMIDTQRTTLRDGLIYAVCFEDEPLVKQVLKEAGGGLILHSYNARFPDRHIGPQQMDRIKVIGEVVYRSGSGFTAR